MKLHAKKYLAVLALLLGIQLTHAQTAFIPLYSFTDNGDGSSPVAGLVQASDGNLYGTTYEGGANGDGAIFRITPGGSLTPLYSFKGGNDGAHPYSGLIQASDGNLYGTTAEGGANGDGVIFRITTNGTQTPLYSFTGGRDGASPRGGLLQASDGNLYGTTTEGGTNGEGAFFRMTINGALTPLYSFTDGHDGGFPEATLLQTHDGYLYGTTYEGGANGYGVIYRITTNGVLTSLYSFTNGNDGAAPVSGLLQTTDGNLYGTTEDGGANNYGVVFRFATNGVLTPLYSFTDGHDGAYPEGALVQGNDGNLYGTTYEGGANGYGVIFQIATNGALASLYSFTDGHDGANPIAGLALANSGNLFGTTIGGGTNRYGAVFELSLSAPALNIFSEGDQSVLSWPGWANNYVLQSTTNLALPGWTNVTNAMPGTTVTVTNSIPARYFRLVYP